MKFKAGSSSWLLPLFTSVDDLPAHSQHDLTVAGCVGHQVQHLLVGTPLHHHAVDADELVPGPQTSVPLRGSVRDDSPDVHLREDVLTEEQRAQRSLPLASEVVELQNETLRDGLEDAHGLLWTFSAQNTEAKAGLDVPLEENVNVFGVRLCGRVMVSGESCDRG